MPLRERNVLLVSAGFAPVFPQRKLDDPALAAARGAVELLLKAHAPYPAIAIDRHWTLVAANDAAAALMADVGESLKTPPVNVLRLSLDPDGLAPRIINLAEWRAHLLARLRQQIEVTADEVLVALLAELTAYPSPPRAPHRAPEADHAGVIVPLRIKAGGAELSFVSTTTIFGTPVDVTLSELALETFFPADETTAQALRAMAARAT